jgi:hypothetical protein
MPSLPRFGASDNGNEAAPGPTSRGCFVCALICGNAADYSALSSGSSNGFGARLVQFLEANWLKAHLSWAET